MPADLLRVVVNADVSKLPAYVGMPLGEAGYALVRISKITEAGDADNTPEAKQRLSQLIGGAQYASYVASLKSRAEIDIRPQATDQKDTKDAKDPKEGKAAKDGKDAKK
jgi:peptidyl-prolyl cis-trans isomerase D